MKENVLEDGQVYEMGFHILPTVPEEKVQSVVAKLTDSITGNGGAVISEDFPKMRILAYEIKKRVETKILRFNKAYFGWIKFEALGAAVEKIKKNAENDPDILRFIIVKTIKENTLYTPKAPLAAKTNGLEEARVSKDASVLAEKPEVSEEEIDKSIDELLASENEKLPL